MSLLRIKAIAKKEWIHVRRDHMSLAMAFLLPVILLLIYAYAITFDVDNILMVVYDQDKSSMSRDLTAQFTESGYFTAVAYPDSYAADRQMPRFGRGQGRPRHPFRFL